MQKPAMEVILSPLAIHNMLIAAKLQNQATPFAKVCHRAFIHMLI